jgi:hypothetical protein
MGYHDEMSEIMDEMHPRTHMEWATKRLINTKCVKV